MEKWQNGHWLHQWGFPPFPHCQVLSVALSSGCDATASTWPEEGNMSWLLTEQTKAIQTVITFLWKTCSHLFVTVSIWVPFLFLFTHSLYVIVCVYHVCVCVLRSSRKCVCACVYMYKLLWELCWVWNSSLSDVKVNKDADSYFTFTWWWRAVTGSEGNLAGELQCHQV